MSIREFDEFVKCPNVRNTNKDTNSTENISKGIFVF